MGVRYFYSPYKTETAYNYTVSDFYSTRGVAIRLEKILTSDVPNTNFLRYTREEGAVVIPGSSIATVYNSLEEIQANNAIDKIQNEIAILKEAEQGSQQYLGIDTFSAQVNKTVWEILNSVKTGDLSDLSSQRDKLQLLLGKHRIFINRDSDFSYRISALTEHQAQLSGQISQSSSYIYSSMHGYFSSNIDGLETVLTTDFESLSVNDYKRIINGNYNANIPTNAVAKVQQGHDWYLAICIPKSELGRFPINTDVTLNLNMKGCNSIPAVISRVIEDEKEAIVIFKTDYINEQLISTRNVNIDVNFKSYIGLRVSSEALRYVGYIEGVYVKSGTIIKFKPIERVYTGDSFVLCTPMIFTDEENQQKYREQIKQFDEVVTKGTDLYDGKIL